MIKIYHTVLLFCVFVTIGTAQKRSVSIDITTIRNITNSANKGEAVVLPEQISELYPVSNNLISSELKSDYPNLRSYDLLDQDGRNIGDLVLTSKGLSYNIEQSNGNVASLFPNHANGGYLFEETTDVYWTCATEELKEIITSNNRSDIGKYTYGDDLQSFRLAVIATGEFYEQHGNTDELVVADIVKTISGVNRIFERDFSLNFTLSGRVKLYFDKTSDPFTPENNGGNSRTIQSSSAFNTDFDSETYDLGITFNSFSDGWPGGGVAVIQAACNPGSNLSGPTKARIWAASVGVADNGFTALVAHEIGHAFGARHTMNSDAEICESALSPDNAYEIGSGNTIMSYGGQCGEGDDYVQVREIINNYFHFSSLYLMSKYVETLNCQSVLTTTNTPPDITVNPCNMDAFQIPLGTPFSIRAEGSDDNSDNLTYVWEQFDEDGGGSPNAGFLGPDASLSARGPLFRGYAPNANPSRDFPRFFNYFFEDPFETLSKVPRDLTLRCTVRDNDTEGGIFTSDEVTVNVMDAGPFEIEIDSLIDTIVGGETINLMWNDDGISDLCDRVDVNLISLTDPNIVIPIATDVAYSDFGLQYFVAPGFSIDGDFHFKVECHISDCFSFYSFSRPFFSTTNCPAPELYYTCGLDDITANIGADELNQTAEAYTGVNFYSKDFVIDAQDQSMQFVRYSLLGACEELLFPSGNPVRTNFEFINFQVSESGTYTFKSPSPIAGLAIFDGSTFDMNAPCSSLVGAGLTESTNAPGTTTTTYSGDFTVDLEACISYRLGMTSFENDIMFSVSIEGDGIISIETGNELAGDFFYIVENEENIIEAILAEADFRGLRQGQKNVYTIKVDAETFNPSEFIGMQLSDLGIGGVCVERSTNTTDMLLINPLPDEDMDGYHTDEDCDDNDPNINPGAPEIINNTIDENCDGIIEGVDNDNDGFNAGFDCDDNNMAINPDAEEIPNNDVDEDCDGVALIIDEDMDGFNSDVDCNDSDAAINPDAEEIPNNDVDENCDGVVLIIDADMDGFNSDVDCDDSNPDANPGAEEIPNNDVDENCDGEILVIDADMDGFNSDEDCNDDDASINPDAEEIPSNEIDENCDGIVLNFDADMDGFNSEDDCNDMDASINPDAEEIANNDIDENCDGELLFIDEDMDGYNSAVDCNDLDSLINPGAIEIPNNDVDENCDGAVILIDDDMDGFNSDVDCDDTNAAVNPEAEEIPNNDIDEDCDGIALVVDEDMDGFNSDEDCNDLDSLINPAAIEIPNNNIDENCNGELGFTDEDMDGFNANVDCNDLDSLIYPGATEIPNNGIDENCDGEDLISSVDDQVLDQVEIYPNPFIDIVTIDLGESIGKVAIYNVNGILVKALSNQNQKHVIDFRSIETGVYFVRIIISNRKHQIYRKIVKI